MGKSIIGELRTIGGFFFIPKIKGANTIGTAILRGFLWDGPAKGRSKKILYQITTSYNYPVFKAQALV
jgi:hypothetical protein